MEIKGLEELSTVDWGDRMVTTLFIPSCNFRCGFCFNIGIVLEPHKLKTISWDTVEDHLIRRRKWLDGVVITGGEPTIHDDLPELCIKIKKLGYDIKLDTNGTNPIMLKYLIKNELVDYVAMDIKAPLDKYKDIIGVTNDYTTLIKESIRVLKMLSVESLEFRTTIVPGFHSSSDLVNISKLIGGPYRYYLQLLKENTDTLDSKYENIKPYTESQLLLILDDIQRYTPNAKLR